MRKHHTKNKGDLGVLKAQLALFEQEYLVLLPQSEHCEFDLVAYKDSVFKRIQVKYRSIKNGVINLHFRSLWADKNGNHIVQIDKSKIDLYCVYCPDTDKCYWIDPSKYEKSVTIRFEKQKNNQKANVNLSSKFLTIPE